MSGEKATLALADGTLFHGYAVGSIGETSGEVVFNTSMTGYQEITTDPSYCNQMLTFTYPHIGNVGANSEDVESPKVQVSGVIVRELSRHYSNFRAEQSFDDYLKDNSVVGIGGIDTRKLVVHLRDNGSQMGVISSTGEDDATLVDKAKSLPSMEGQNLAEVVSTREPYDWNQGTYELGRGYRKFSDAELNGRPLVVAIDYGVKFNILRLLAESGFRVKVVPANFSAEQILELGPDAVFLSNGPGDPAAVTQGIKTVSGLVGKKPMFGICLGHQILGHALGAPTFKLKFGHRGGNHPVRDERTGKVEITVQNHGFATDLAKVPSSLCVSHINLNDNTVEGFQVPEAKAFSIQYHPESSPGPHDASYLFEEFYQLATQ
ncbi:MAG: glutamine-hydrolyzing carbamoyl-phosphate synthase small subunit [Bdellovibrionales bacterium]|nr:glutamine-hydrolyzing carbamoyl-phosphate synthase small subunit [Bdellovibrionales bacterium]